MCKEADGQWQFVGKKNQAKELQGLMCEFLDKLSHKFQEAIDGFIECEQEFAKFVSGVVETNAMFTADEYTVRVYEFEIHPNSKKAFCEVKEILNRSVRDFKPE